MPGWGGVIQVFKSALKRRERVRRRETGKMPNRLPASSVVNEPC